MAEKITYRYQWPCRIVGVYDGDTARLEIDRGFRDYKKVSARLHGLDCPEIRKAKGVPLKEVAIFKAAARMARDVATTFLMVPDSTFHFYSTELDKYERPVGDIIRLEDGKSLCDLLLKERLAVPYDGGNRSSQAFLDLHRENIDYLCNKKGLTEHYGL